MTIKSNLDLYLVALASLLLIPAVVLSGSIAVRLILTIPLLLFAPGYAIVSAFFPGKSGPSGIERITYGVVLSIAVVMLDGLLLNYIWSIDVYPLLITLEGLTLVLLIIAWLRRRSLTEDERLVFRSGASGMCRGLMAGSPYCWHGRYRRRGGGCVRRREKYAAIF